jgi:hypothetical protein
MFQITNVWTNQSLFTMWLIIFIAMDSPKLSTKCGMKYTRSSIS